MATERTAIIVAGMHRSGTSATTRILHLLGAGLADDLIPADIGNERGHWESRAVQALHNALLAELGSDIYSPVNIAPGWFDSAAARPWIDRIRDLIAGEYATSALFVLKDPRIALLLPLWIAALRESAIVPRFVLPFRQPDAVADSLERRERRLDSGNALPQAQGVAVWLRYVLAAEKYTRGEVRAFVAFDDVLADWRGSFARIAQQLGIEWPNAQRADARIDEFLEARDRAHAAVSPGNDTAASDIVRICSNVYADLERAVCDPQAALPAFDAAARALAAAEALLGAHLVARERVFDDLRRRVDAESRRHAIEHADLHGRFDAELGLRDARIAEATAHALQLEQAAVRAIAHAETLERERSSALDYATSLERDRDRAFAHATSLEQDRDRAVEYTAQLERDRDRAIDYAASLELDRDAAVEYARSLERARDEAMQPDKPEVHAPGETPVFFTIASRNYLAYAKTLMQSVAEHHPGAPRYLILADRGEDDPALAAASFDVIPASALALPDFDAFAFRYKIMEFNTAIKPYAFAHLRGLHPRAGIVYLDPDILVIEPLARVEAAFAEGALAVLTPHLLDPVDDDRQPGERDMLTSGTYNCGFVAIGAHDDADRLIAWWADRLEFGAYSDIAAGLFTDQKWVDLVPGLFPDVRILRDEGYNLAYWNLSQRPVSRRDSRWYAGERPLVFVHFSGVDLDRPAQFSKHQNRHTQATIGELQPLYADYLDRLATNGHAEHRLKPYAFGRFDDGEPICDPVRSAFRRYFDKGRAQPQREPFAMDRALYDLPCAELSEQSDAPVTCVMYAVWQMRADLQRAFDLGTAEGRDRFVHWFVHGAEAEMGIPDRYFDPARRVLAAREAARAPNPAPDDVPANAPTNGTERNGRSPPLPRGAASRVLQLIDWSCRFGLALRVYALIPERMRQSLRRRLERNAQVLAVPTPQMPEPQREPENPPGINLVGYAHGEFGVAEILRRYAHALQSGGVPFVVRNFDTGVASRQRDDSMRRFLSAECRYGVNLFCINADQTPIARAQLGDAVFGGRYNIACWFWELEKFPQQWHGAIDLVDEIWVSSTFVRDAVAACTTKPVHVVPIALDADLPAHYSRAAFGLDEDDFVYLFSFDFNSFVVRKNAEGVIAAFRRAFRDGRRGVRLLIKTINGERFPEALRTLAASVADDDRIEVRDGFLDRRGMWALQACCDGYVSLHRSEGLGLGMAECMLLGKPVVATAYSGNLAFMDADNSCLVDYSLIPVNEGEYPAWQGQRWAEPDIDQAAAYLRRLADDPAYAREIGEKAKASVRRRLSVEASLAAVTARLADIRARPS